MYPNICFILLYIPFKEPLKIPRPSWLQTTPAVAQAALPACFGWLRAPRGPGRRVGMARPGCQKRAVCKVLLGAPFEAVVATIFVCSGILVVILMIILTPVSPPTTVVLLGLLTNGLASVSIIGAHHFLPQSCDQKAATPSR